MIENRNIICIASNWYYDPTSKHHVMKLLAGRNHVVWVNYHGSRRPSASVADAGAVMAKLRQVIQGPRRAGENITVVTPLVVPWPGNPTVASLNRRLLTRQIRGVLRNLPDRPTQLWSFAPDVDYLCGQFDEEHIVYYCVDAFSEFAGYDREAILAAERRLARKADLLITTSQALFDDKRALNDNTILVPHGVDHAHFARAADDRLAIPSDIAALRRPVLGFWGLIEDWLNVPLIAEVAAARPDWSIVLLGDVSTDVSRLAGLPNVHLLGRRRYADLPAYARGFDVGLIPFRINALTRAVNPIKLREYLAAGLPVVSTPLPEVRKYRPFVEIAASPEAFIAACDRAIATDSEDAHIHRRAAMRGESWPAKVEEISKALDAVRRTNV
jgi:glycosyltransferase involved in cell wall biosynthesis